MNETCPQTKRNTSPYVALFRAVDDAHDDVMNRWQSSGYSMHLLFTTISLRLKVMRFTDSQKSAGTLFKLICSFDAFGDGKGRNSICFSF